MAIGPGPCSLKKIVLQQPAGLNGCWIMLGLPRKKSKGPYLWRCWSSVLELHSRPRFLARNDLLQAVPITCSDTWFGSLVPGEAPKDYKNLMPKKQQYHMKRRHHDVIISFERLQADFLNFGVILAITRLIQEEGQSGNDVPLLKVTLVATKV